MKLTATVSTKFWTIKFTDLTELADFLDRLHPDTEAEVNFDGLPQFPDEE